MIVADVYFSRVVGVRELVVERKEGKEKKRELEGVVVYYLCLMSQIARRRNGIRG